MWIHVSPRWEEPTKVEAIDLVRVYCSKGCGNELWWMAEAIPEQERTWTCLECEILDHLVDIVLLQAVDKPSQVPIYDQEPDNPPAPGETDGPEPLCSAGGSDPDGQEQQTNQLGVEP